MTPEKELEYSQKYYKGAKKFSYIFSSLVIIFGIFVLTVALILIINRQTKPIIIVSTIMIIAGILDISLGAYFIFNTNKRISRIKRHDAALRYMRIYGIKEKK